ncbi:hypothetical protein AYK26_02210 [Euryarchaeota archaeon SM23-78]|nr:MAG: hypothetical protein AYK26_02210 [Euryarchaeota archaeon SM23-78]
MKKQETLKKILDNGLVPVFAPAYGLELMPSAEAIYKAGVRCFEITARTPNCLEGLKKVKDAFPHIAVGIASLIDYPEYLKKVNNLRAPDLQIPSPEQAMHAGADFLVSGSTFRHETYQNLGDNLIIIPGTQNLEQMLQEMNKGANIIKFFPADILGGPSIIKKYQDPTHKSLPIAPSSGVNFNTAPEYLKVGCVALVMSMKQLADEETRKRMVETGDYTPLAEGVAKALRFVREHRQPYENRIFNVDLSH